MKDKIEVVDDRQHYFDLGKFEGKSLFKLTDFLYGLSIGLCVGVFIAMIVK